MIQWTACEQYVWDFSATTEFGCRRRIFRNLQCLWCVSNHGVASRMRSWCSSQAVFALWKSRCVANMLNEMSQPRDTTNDKWVVNCKCLCTCWESGTNTWEMPENNCALQNTIKFVCVRTSLKFASGFQTQVSSARCTPKVCCKLQVSHYLWWF